MSSHPTDPRLDRPNVLPLDEIVYNDPELNKDYLYKKDVKAVYYFHSQTSSIFKVNVEDDAIGDKIYLNVISERAQRQFDLQNEGIVATIAKPSFHAKMDTVFHLRSSVEVNEEVLVQKDASTKAWLKAQVIEFIREKREVTVDVLVPGGQRNRTFRITVPFHRISYFVPPCMNLAKAFRIVAKVFSKGGKPSYLSGRIVDLAKRSNRFRFLVFFESGITSYVNKKDISVILDQSRGFEVFNTFQKDFLTYYFKHYPEVHMARFKPGDKSLIRLKMPNQSEELYVRATGVVTKVDCKLVQFHVQAYQTSVWLYRGDYTRILSIESDLKEGGIKRSRPLRNLGLQSKNVIEVTIDDDQNEVIETLPDEQLTTIEQPKLQRLDDVQPEMPTEIALKDIEKHTCSSACPKEEKGDTPPNCLNMFIIPIWFGWKRLYDIKYDHSKVVFYLAPCGVKFYDMEAIFDWLQATGSRLQIDQFNLDRDFVVEETASSYQGYHVFLRDISNGREKVPVSLINTLNHDTLFNFEYIAEREFDKNIELELDTNFMVCCDCTDDCRNPEKCACQALTWESMRPVHEFEEFPMKNRLLYQKVLSGIYECNKGCACRKQQCVNRNAQLGLRNKLQLFKTFNKGWGVRTLHDIPKGKVRDRSEIGHSASSCRWPLNSVADLLLSIFASRLVHLHVFRSDSGQPDGRRAGPGL